jgi:hypothetical protein
MSSITSINRRLVRLTVAAAAVASLAAPAAAVAHPSADVARRAGLAQIKRVAERAAPRGYGSRVNRVGGEVDHRRTAFGGYSVLVSRTGAVVFCPVQVDIGAGGGVVAVRRYTCHTGGSPVAVASGAKWHRTARVARVARVASSGLLAAPYVRG